MIQTTIDEQIDRCWRLERLQACAAKWQERELDRLLPEEYAALQRKINCLASGEPYTVTRFDPMAVLQAMDERRSSVREEMNKTATGRMVWDIAQGLAGISRRQDVSPASKMRHSRRKQVQP